MTPTVTPDNRMFTNCIITIKQCTKLGQTWRGGLFLCLPSIPGRISPRKAMCGHKINLWSRTLA